MAIYYKTEGMTSFVFEIRSVPFSSDMDRVRLEPWLGLGSLFGGKTRGRVYRSFEHR